MNRIYNNCHIPDFRKASKYTHGNNIMYAALANEMYLFLNQKSLL